MNGGEVKVERVVCAVDCGIAVNPDVIRAQMEGGIGFGLAAALAEAITIEGGRVEQSNFHDYTPLRIDQMPKVEVHIVPSAEPPTGVGEPGVPPIAPAVANAIAAATGQRIRSLPFAKTKLGCVRSATRPCARRARRGWRRRSSASRVARRRCCRSRANAAEAR